MPLRPSASRQLLDLAFPFSLYEQAPFVGRDVSALTITTQGDTPAPAELDTEAHLRTLLQSPRMGQLGGAAQTLVGSIDQGLTTTPGGAPYLYFGSRAVRGWAVQLVLVAALLPFLAAAVDLFARCRRRRIPLGPAVRSYLSRLAFWLFVGLAFAVVARLGGWPQGDPLPIPPQAAAGTDVAGARDRRARAGVLARVDRRAAPAHPAPRGRARGGAGRLHGCAADAGARVAPRRRGERLRARLRSAVAPRVALATAVPVAADLDHGRRCWPRGSPARRSSSGRSSERLGLGANAAGTSSSSSRSATSPCRSSSSSSRGSASPAS